MRLSVPPQTSIKKEEEDEVHFDHPSPVFLPPSERKKKTWLGLGGP